MSSSKPDPKISGSKITKKAQAKKKAPAFKSCISCGATYAGPPSITHKKLCPFCMHMDAKWKPAW